MKKIIFIVFASFAVVSCKEDDCNHIIPPPTETLFEYLVSETGIWYNEEKNEEDRYSPSGTFYARFCNLDNTDEAQGNFTTSSNDRLTWTYKSTTGTEVLDWIVSDINDISFKIKSNYASLLYGKILGVYNLEVGNIQQIQIPSKYDGYKVLSYNSKNNRIASVSNSGLITSSGEKGTTYVKVTTNHGDAWIKVVVGTDNFDLWYDFISVLGKNYSEIRGLLGTPDVIGEDDYSFGFRPQQHVYIDSIYVFLDQDDGLTSEIQLKMRSNISEVEVLSYMNSRYYRYDDIDDYILFSNLSFFDERSDAVIVYDKKEHMVFFFDMYKFLHPIKPLWRDYTPQFGKDNIFVKSAMNDLGYDFLQTFYTYSANGSDVYIISDSEYADYVEFVFNSNAVVSEIWVYMDISKDATDVYKYLLQDYFEEEDESTSYNLVFYNDDKKLKIVLDLYNGAVIYRDLTLDPPTPSIPTSENTTSIEEATMDITFHPFRKHVMCQTSGTVAGVKSDVMLQSPVIKQDINGIKRIFKSFQ